MPWMIPWQLYGWITLSEKRLHIGNLGSVVHLPLITPTAIPTITPIVTSKIASANKHLRAHLSSALRMIVMSSCLSDSGLLAWKSVGAESGEIRIMTPNSQNGGKTTIIIGNQLVKVKLRSKRNRRTKSKFKQIHSKSDRFDRCSIISWQLSAVSSQRWVGRR